MLSQRLFALLIITLVISNSWAKESDIFNQVIASIHYANQSRLVLVADYQDAVYDAIRKRYYHGKPPEGEEKKLKSEIWEQMVTETLLWMHYENEDNVPNIKSSLQKKLSQYETKYENNPQWAKMKDRVLPVVKRRFTRDLLTEMIKERFISGFAINDKEAHQYYLQHPQLFTEPERNEVSIILINVEPSSSSDIWEIAIEQLKKIKKEINNLADFSEKAVEFSTDSTANKGGNMGVLHEGQLGGRAKEIISQLKVGEVSEPVVLLEGVALFTVTKKIGATHHTFDEVKPRAGRLALRDKRKKSWEKHLLSLKNNADITAKIDIQALINQ